MTDNGTKEIHEAMEEFDLDSVDVGYKGGMICEDRNHIEKRVFMDASAMEDYR